MHESFTRPSIFWSGATLRTEATGYGLVFFAQLMLSDMNKELKGLRCMVSGSEKIAMHVLEKLIAYGALPISVSDSKGYLVDEDGFDYMKNTISERHQSSTEKFEVVAGELELNHECSLMHWSPEDFESKL
ncbi:hypothetical protein HN51_036895 [Arachis hypogaea]